MSTDYILFDETLRDHFLGFVAGLGIASQFRPDRIAGFVIELPDGLSEEMQAVIELEYDVLLDQQRDLIDVAEGGEAQDAVGVIVTLPDGQSRQVRLPGAYARRLAAHFSFEEIHELVTVIAHSVANPVAGPLCRARGATGGA